MEESRMMKTNINDVKSPQKNRKNPLLRRNHRHNHHGTNKPKRTSNAPVKSKVALPEDMKRPLTIPALLRAAVSRPTLPTSALDAVFNNMIDNYVLAYDISDSKVSSVDKQ